MSRVTFLIKRALKMDWNEVVPANELSFVFGNPPFIGFSEMKPTQKRSRFYDS